MVIDNLTRDRWMAEFAIYAASQGYDVVCIVSQDGVTYFSGQTQELWRAYRIGRLHQSVNCSVSIVTVPVVSAIDWYEINNTARG